MQSSPTLTHKADIHVFQLDNNENGVKVYVDRHAQVFHVHVVFSFMILNYRILTERSALNRISENVGHRKRLAASVWLNMPRSCTCKKKRNQSKVHTVGREIFALKIFTSHLSGEK